MDQMPNVGKKSTTSQCYVFSIRWTVENIPNHDHTSLLRLFTLLCEKFIFQLEDTTNNLHYQCYCRWKKKQYAKTLAKRLNDQFLGIEIRPASDNGKLALAEYCLKDDTRVKGPWADRPIYLGSDLCCMKNPYPWQQTVIDFVEEPPDDRTINWVYNPEGCVGKSKLCKFLKFTKKWKRIPLGTATQLKTNCVVKGPHRAYYVDMPRVRGREEHVADLISAIEDIKNGDVESAMFGKEWNMMMLSPHVWIFSNDPPPWKHCSEDRWKAWTVKDMKLYAFEERGNVNALWRS